MAPPSNSRNDKAVEHMVSGRAKTARDAMVLAGGFSNEDLDNNNMQGNIRRRAKRIYDNVRNDNPEMPTWDEHLGKKRKVAGEQSDDGRSQTSQVSRGRWTSRSAQDENRSRGRSSSRRSSLSPPPLVDQIHSSSRSESPLPLSVVNRHRSRSQVSQSSLSQDKSGWSQDDESQGVESVSTLHPSRASRHPIPQSM